jgi:hypothetical protein
VDIEKQACEMKEQRSTRTRLGTGRSASEPEPEAEQVGTSTMGSRQRELREQKGIGEGLQRWELGWGKRSAMNEMANGRAQQGRTRAHQRVSRARGRDRAPSTELRPEPEAQQAGSHGDERSSSQTKGGGAAKEETGEGRSARAER